MPNAAHKTLADRIACAEAMAAEFGFGHLRASLYVDAIEDNGVKHKLAAWPFRAFVGERATRRLAYVSTMNDAEFDVMTLYDFFQRPVH